MRSDLQIRIFSCLVALGVCFLTAAAPCASGPQEIGNARTVLAIVDDPRTRRPIVDVGADDFIVQEGAESREILSVRMADYPVVVMIDISGPADELALIQKAAKHFIQRLGNERAVAVGAFGSSPTILAGFDADRADLLNKVDEVVAATSGNGSALQAAALAAQTLAATGSLFSSIVVLSGGGTDGSAPESQDVVAPLVGSGAILHVVASRAGQSDGATTSKSGGTTALRTLAAQTRGQFITIYTAASYQAALEQIAVRMASELMIEYLVPKQSKPADVRLGVRIAGARVRGFGVAPR